MQTEMSRGPLAEDEHSRKGMVGGGLRPPPRILFLPWSSSAFPLAFLSAFVHGLVGSPRNVENYLNQKWTTLARSRLVARSIVCLISRRPEELEAENYTMRIAAKRSCPRYGLEGSYTIFLMDYEGFGARSGEVDWNRRIFGKVFGAFLGRPDGFGGWDFVRIQIFQCRTCPYRFWELILSKLSNCWHWKGRIFSTLFG